MGIYQDWLLFHPTSFLISCFINYVIPICFFLRPEQLVLLFRRTSESNCPNIASERAGRLGKGPRRVSPGDLMDGLGSRWYSLGASNKKDDWSKIPAESKNMRIVIMSVSHFCWPQASSKIWGIHPCVWIPWDQNIPWLIFDTLHENSWIELCMNFVKIHFN